MNPISPTQLLGTLFTPAVPSNQKTTNQADSAGGIAALSAQVTLSPQAKAMQAREHSDGSGVIKALMVNAIGAQADRVDLKGNFKQELFKLADDDGDGVVTQQELQERSVAGGGTAVEADEMFSQLDTKNDGGISAQEFNEGVSTPVSGNFGDQLVKIFDADGDGKLAKAELDEILLKNTEKAESGTRA